MHNEKFLKIIPMTRINCGIPVEALTDEHLLAEHREIKRLPDNFIKALSSGALKRIPATFCLGPGHITFFLNKQLYLYTRYGAIHNECLRRGFKVASYFNNWHNLLLKFKEHNCWRDYFPGTTEGPLVRERIANRIEASPKAQWHYWGKTISKQEAINLLNKKV